MKQRPWILLVLTLALSCPALLFAQESGQEGRASGAENVPTGTWDEFCTITAPEGKYVRLLYGQPVIKKEDFQQTQTITYAYDVGAMVLCDGGEPCFRAEHQEYRSFHISFDDSWLSFPEADGETGWVSIGFYILPNRDRSMTYSRYYYGESSLGWFAGGEELFGGTYNICENVRLTYREDDRKEYCPQCHGYDEFELALAYEGNGELTVLTSYDEANTIVEEQHQCGSIAAGADTTLAPVGMLIVACLLLGYRRAAQKV